ncbi:transcriptional repressor XylR [Staphylococcus xylosus]|uniref:transcriptional repressor XylR n=1 Tax=Staphylococcus xylosus TaxID=1288 RepID=UPI001073631F|nr:ROK family protein [Staphylococcus xylosus]MBF0814420.1 ROK family protein [Staphylococcus saprophyticus]NQD98942.1 ROK family transcriptional regulator [Staphylococcus xylosus]TFV22330.1 ROK family transcriptional regulator [Staphylococcus saprophyticus]
MENNLIVNENEKRVLKQIFNNSNISRTQISKNLELNKATISNILNNLKHKSLVNEVGEGNSTKSGGRKPILLEINQKYGYYISMDLTYDSVELMYNYFDATILKQDSYELKDKNVSSILQILKSNINVSEKHDTLHGLLGISISIHGIVDDEQNIINLPFHKNERSTFTDELKSFTNVPVVIENEANLSALYEKSLYINSNIANLITLSIHKGIGAGIVINKKLYRGSNGEAGEIGKTLVLGSINDNGNKYYKIEDICSQDALIQKINNRLGAALTFTELIQYYNAGNSIVAQEIEQFINRMAVLIHNLNTQFNPDAIYINCPLINELPNILNEIKKQFSYFSQASPIQIHLTTNVKQATLLGGTLAIMQKTLNINNIQMNIK